MVKKLLRRHDLRSSTPKPSIPYNDSDPRLKIDPLAFFRTISQAQGNLSRAITTYMANSVSNSSAKASPSSNFPAYLTSITSALDALTTHAAQLPSRSDLSFHRTLDRGFAKELDVISRDVLRTTERLAALVDTGKGGARRKLKEEEDVMDGYRRGVQGVVDGLLEDAASI